MLGFTKTTRSARNGRRKIGLKKLQDRRLMAADFGIISIHGPQMRPTESTPAQFSGSNVSSTSQVEMNVERGVLKISGTTLRDDVQVTYDSGYILVIATTTNDQYEPLATNAQYFYNSAFSIIRFDAGDGNDVYNNETSKTSLVYGGSGIDQLSGGESYGGGFGNDLLDGGDDGVRDYLYGNDGADRFIRHKHFGADDPDRFMDIYHDFGDKKENDWYGSNYGNNFPTP